MINQNISTKNKETSNEFHATISSNDTQSSPKVIFMKLPIEQYSSTKSKENLKLKKSWNPIFVEDYIHNLYKKTFEQNENKNKQIKPSSDRNSNLSKTIQKIPDNREIEQIKKMESPKQDVPNNFLINPNGI